LIEQIARGGTATDYGTVAAVGADHQQTGRHSGFGQRSADAIRSARHAAIQFQANWPRVCQYAYGASASVSISASAS
jgi:hypothetical protein